MESITHWHENLEMLMWNKMNNDSLYEDLSILPEDCALCILCYDKAKINSECSRCPIYKKTNLVECCGSPWSSVNNLMYFNNYPKLYKAIVDELNFLYSLLED